MCGAPIDSGIQRGSLDDVFHIIRWTFDCMTCVDLLSRCCINCVYNIVQSGAYMKHRSLEPDLMTRTNLAAARYAATVLKERSAPRRRKKREVIALYPDPDTSREELMLMLMLVVTRMIDWLNWSNRDISMAINRAGTSLLWEESAHFRRLRKTHGIKGAVCKAFDPNNFTGASIGATAFRNWREFIDEAKDAERRLTEATDDYDLFLEQLGWSNGNYVPVWLREYRIAHFKSMAPIQYRLRVFKVSKIRRQDAMDAVASLHEEAA